MEEEDGRVKQENNSLDESASGFGAAAVGPVSILTLQQLWGLLTRVQQRVRVV